MPRKKKTLKEEELAEIMAKPIDVSAEVTKISDDYMPKRRDAIELAAGVAHKVTQAQRMQLLRSMIGATDKQKNNGKERLKEYNEALKEAARIQRVGWIPEKVA